MSICASAASSVARDFTFGRQAHIDMPILTARGIEMRQRGQYERVSRLRTGSEGVSAPAASDLVLKATPRQKLSQPGDTLGVIRMQVGHPGGAAS